MNIDERVKSLEKEVLKINNRNLRVEQNKSWETSTMRKVVIGLMTYLLISIFLISIDYSHPLLNSIVPTLGYLLSTLSLNAIKKYWIKNMIK